MFEEFRYQINLFKCYLDSNINDDDKVKKHKTKRSYLSPKLSEDIKDRDSNSCFICGNKNDLESHHIFGFSEYPFLAIYPENIITLCHTCHSEYHSKYDNINAHTWSMFIRDLKKPIVKTETKIKVVEKYPQRQSLINNDPNGTVIHTIRKEKGHHINHGKLISVMQTKYDIPINITEGIIRKLLNRKTIVDVGGEYYLKGAKNG